MEIIVKNFTPHYNVALGKVIRNERQYKDEMKRGNFIPYEAAQERDKAASEKRHQYSISDKAVDWMRNVKDTADRKGNVKLSDRQIEVMNETSKPVSRENPALKEAMAKYEGRFYCS